MSIQNFPDTLQQKKNWVCWKFVTKDGEPTKLPFDARTGRAAKANDPDTWTTFEQASQAADILGGNDYEGIGFELGGTDIAGIDFDSAINAKGDIDPYVVAILALLGNPYTETSPSGNGLHAFVECDALPEGKRKMSKNHEGVEIYHGREGGRYFTCTGEKVLGDGVPRIEDMELPYLLLNQNKNKRFKALWLGDTSVCGNDDSSADFALMSELAKLTQNDPVKMEKFFGLSVLGQRDKWNRADYRQRTIKAALDRQPKESTTNVQSRELAFHLPPVESDPNRREYVIAPAAKQKSGWFMLGGVPSILCGPSGANKTTWMYQLLTDQKMRVPVYGHETYERPYITLGADRGEADHLETMERMHLSPSLIPFKPLSTVVFDFDAVQAILDEIESTSPLPEIVFVEGVDMLVSKMNDIKAVAYFMHEIHKIAKRYNIAFVLSAGSPKTKEGHGYAATRDNIIGSSGWGRCAGAVVSLLFPKNDDGSSGQRKLTVMLRNAPTEKFTLAFAPEGRLEIDPNSHDEGVNEAEQESKEIEWYKTQARLAKTDPSKKWWTIVDIERALHLTHATADRHVKSDKQKGRLKQKSGKRCGRGSAAEYCWNESKGNRLWVEQQAQEAADQLEVF